MSLSLCVLCVFRQNLRSFPCLFVVWHLQWVGIFTVSTPLFLSSRVPRELVLTSSGCSLASLSNILPHVSDPEMEMAASGRGSWLWAPCTPMSVGDCGVRDCGAGQLVRAHIRDKALLCVWGTASGPVSSAVTLHGESGTQAGHW